MSQMLFQIVLAPVDWARTNPVDEPSDVTFSEFSVQYMTVLIFVIECFITMKKDLRIFIKVASYGTFFIIALILFIIGVGIYSLTNTPYEVLMTHTANNNYADASSMRYIFGIN